MVSTWFIVASVCEIKESIERLITEKQLKERQDYKTESALKSISVNFGTIR